MGHQIFCIVKAAQVPAAARQFGQAWSQLAGSLCSELIGRPSMTEVQSMTDHILVTICSRISSTEKAPTT